MCAIIITVNKILIKLNKFGEINDYLDDRISLYLPSIWLTEDILVNIRAAVILVETLLVYREL